MMRVIHLVLHVVGDGRMQTLTWLQSCQSKLFCKAVVCYDPCEHASLHEISSV